MNRMEDGEWKMKTPAGGASRIPHSARRRRGGFSLTEVVLAVAIVAIAAVGVMTAFPTAVMASRDAQDENMMALIAADIFAQMRAAPYGGTAAPKVPYVTSPTGGPAFAKWDFRNYRTGAGVGVNNFFYYSRNGRPANEVSDPSKLGCPPNREDPYKPDEGYFGVRVIIYSDAYNTHIPTSSTNLVRAIISFSWPARAEWSSTINRRKTKQFVTHIADLH